PPVDLARGKGDPPSFGQGGDGVHEVGHWGTAPFSRPLAAAAGVSTHGTRPAGYVEIDGLPGGLAAASRMSRASGGRPWTRMAERIRWRYASVGRTNEPP